MIQNSNIEQKHDRLTAFLKAFTLSAMPCESAEEANLLIIDTKGSGRPTHLLYRARSTAALADGAALCVAAKVDFGGDANPLVGALPDELCFSLSDAAIAWSVRVDLGRGRSLAVAAVQFGRGYARSSSCWRYARQ